jgi:hypothetical protein
MTPYEEGRRVGRLQLACSINPHPERTQAAIEWAQGWLREISLQKRTAPKPAPRSSALVHPFPNMTATQIDLLCRREGLALAHLGRARFVLVPTGNRPETMLRIVSAPDLKAPA